MIKKAVILASGLGTRFLPITKSIPKAMLPIIDQPVIDMVVDEVIASGITDILIITNDFNDAIEQYYDTHFTLEKKLLSDKKEADIFKMEHILGKAKISFAYQKEMKGTGDATLFAKEFVGNEPFVLLFADNLFVPYEQGIKILVDDFEQHRKTIIGIIKVKKEHAHRYGCIKYQGDQVIDLIEKPSPGKEPSLDVNAGRFVLLPETFKYLETIKEQDGEYYLHDAILTMIKNGYVVHTSNITGKYYDMGDKASFVKAIIDFSLKRDDLKEEVTKHIKELEL